jgi:hypothetical protein
MLRFFPENGVTKFLRNGGKMFFGFWRFRTVKGVVGRGQEGRVWWQSPGGSKTNFLSEKEIDFLSSRIF